MFALYQLDGCVPVALRLPGVLEPLPEDEDALDGLPLATALLVALLAHQADLATVRVQAPKLRVQRRGLIFADLLVKQDQGRARQNS